MLTREQLLAEIEALKEQLQRGASGKPVSTTASLAALPLPAAGGRASAGWVSPVVLFAPARSVPLRLSIYVVFHDTVEPTYYDALDDHEKATLTLYGVKERRATGMKTVYEDELPRYNPSFQKNHYQEGSALYHVYANSLARGSDYVGFFQYDMKFGEGAINIATDIVRRSPGTTNIFYMEFFADAFRGGQTAIIADYPKLLGGLTSYNTYFGTRYSTDVLVATKMIIANTFIIPTRLYEKLMAWMTAYFIDDIADCFCDRAHDLEFNPGHIIEALTGMFLALEVVQGAVYHRLPVVHKP
jgi:hypothetical protein